MMQKDWSNIEEVSYCFSSHSSNFKVTREWKSPILTRIECFWAVTATRRRLDCGFLQETKWKGVLCPSQSRSQVRWLKGKDSVYKVFWSGNSEGTNGVGILLAKKWTDKVFEVQHPSDRIILPKLIIGKTVYTLVNVYAPQQGRPEAEKDRFYDQLNAVVARIPLSEVLISGGDWNGHVGRAAGGFE